MIISHKKKFVFIHTPKTAGTTIRTALLPYCENHKYLYQGFTPDGDLQDLTHLRTDQWDLELEQAYQDGYYFFGVIRDPVSRFKSAVSEFHRQHGDWFKSFNLSMEQFLRLMLTPASIKHDWRFIHFCPQHYFFPEVGTERGVQIYTFENMKSWWPSLFYKLDISTPELINNRPTSEADKFDLSPAFVNSICALLYKEDYNKFSDFYSKPSIEEYSLRFHWERIELIHNNRQLIIDTKEKDGTYRWAIDQRAEWDILAINQPTKKLV